MVFFEKTKQNLYNTTEKCREMGYICLTYKVNVLGERQSKWDMEMALLYLMAFY